MRVAGVGSGGVAWLISMEPSIKKIGEHLRRLFTGVIGRPIGWNVIDGLAQVEEQEEALRDAEGKKTSEQTTE